MREGGKEGRREGGREGRRDGWTEGGKEGGRERDAKRLYIIKKQSIYIQVQSKMNQMKTVLSKLSLFLFM